MSTRDILSIDLDRIWNTATVRDCPVLSCRLTPSHASPDHKMGLPHQGKHAHTVHLLARRPRQAVFPEVYLGTPTNQRIHRARYAQRLTFALASGLSHCAYAIHTHLIHLLSTY